MRRVTLLSTTLGAVPRSENNCLANLSGGIFDGLGALTNIKVRFGRVACGALPQLWQEDFLEVQRRLIASALFHYRFSSEV